MEYRNRIKFENGYSANVVCNNAPDTINSYGADSGLFEMAVIGPDGNLDYSTPITSNVIGHLDFHGVAAVLDQIKALPPKPMVKVYKHVITVTVLSEHDDLVYDTGKAGWDLKDIQEVIDNGGAIGDFDCVSSDEVPADKLESELLSVGNDGTYFDELS